MAAKINYLQWSRNQEQSIHLCPMYIIMYSDYILLTNDILSWFSQDLFRPPQSITAYATTRHVPMPSILASSSTTAGVLGVATVTPELDFTSSVPQPSLAVVTHWMYLKRVPLLVCREGGVSRPSCVPPTPRLDIPQAPGRFFEGVACPSASGRDPTRVSNQNLQLGNRWVR